MPMLTPALIDIFWVLLVSSRDEHARLSTIPDTASLFQTHTKLLCIGPKRTEIPISSQLSRTVASSFSWCPLLCKDHIYPLLDPISGCSKSLRMVVCRKNIHSSELFSLWTFCFIERLCVFWCLVLRNHKKVSFDQRNNLTIILTTSNRSLGGLLMIFVPSLF